MKQRKALEFLVEPNGKQIRAMRQYAGNARKVWNLALQQQQKNHTKGEKYTDEFGMNQKKIPIWLVPPTCSTGA
jgi:hypothetical protein